MTRLFVAVTLFVATAALVACGGTAPGGSDPGADGSAATAATGAVTPTLVARLPATATPTPPPDPLAPVASDKVPGVVVPAGAELVAFTPAVEDEDAAADYIVPGISDEDLSAWFLKQMPLHGWDDGEDRGGSLIFLHTTELSARFASEGLKRTATVHFDTIDAPEGATSFSILAEAPGDGE
jgi:hypothetical protein